MRVMFYNSFGNLMVSEIESIWFSEEARELRIKTNAGLAYTCNISCMDKTYIKEIMSKILETRILDLTKYGTFSIYRGFKGN